MIAVGRMPWLFSARVDIAAFGGSALVALLLLLLLPHTRETPEFVWVPAVLLIDVAHVWSTGWRVYLDESEFRRRPLLYSALPLLGFVAGMALYHHGERTFWRVLAYLAVFHFVRQQAGWVALYNRRSAEPSRWVRLVDQAAIYAATLYPLLYWHAHLPRQFAWFVAGDFVAGLPERVVTWTTPIYIGCLVLYALSALRSWIKARPNPGKDLVVLTTFACWYTGMVATNSDYAFTVTNVVIHGVPYFVLIYWYAGRSRDGLRATARALYDRGIWLFLSLLWLTAYVEELVWDRAVWHERAWLFGTGWQIDDWKVVLVPLLAVPQFSHYLLDGFIWRRRDMEIESVSR